MSVESVRAIILVLATVGLVTVALGLIYGLNWAYNVAYDHFRKSFHDSQENLREAEALLQELNEEVFQLESDNYRLRNELVKFMGVDYRGEHWQKLANGPTPMRRTSRTWKT